MIIPVMKVVTKVNAWSAMKLIVTIRRSIERSLKIIQSVKLRLCQHVMAMIYFHQENLEGVKRYKSTSAKYLKEQFERRFPRQNVDESRGNSAPMLNATLEDQTDV